MTKVTITKEALEILSSDQAKAIAHMCTDETHEIDVQQGGFSLPEDYVSFRRWYRNSDGVPIYGGIDQDGRVST